MPVIHRRVDGSGFFLRARVQENWITWQLTRDAEQWLRTYGFIDGETIDTELLEMFIDKNWAYTHGSGAGAGAGAGDGSRPSLLKVGEGVRHEVFGIGEIKELLPGNQSRAVFFREYPKTRIVSNDELSPARSIELARERSMAYTKYASRDRTQVPDIPPASSHHAAPGRVEDPFLPSGAEPGGASAGVLVGRSPSTPSHARRVDTVRWFLVLIGIAIVVFLTRVL